MKNGMDKTEKNMYNIAFLMILCYFKCRKGQKMADYFINTNEMNRIFELLNGVLKIRITFFDLQSNEVNALNIQESSAFCHKMRRNKDFNLLCEECDRKNLELCKLKRDVHVYHCHAGLLEGMVPLYKYNDIYLGAIVFGQVRDSESPVPDEYRSLTEDLPVSTVENMYKIGALLKYLGEYICENELIKRCRQPWTALFVEYVETHLDQQITLGGVSQAVTRSVSFLAHNIPKEFGMTLKQYVRQKRMLLAEKMLSEGKLVRECAYFLGYKDEFYFSRDFKKYFGYAPKHLKHTR